MPCGKGQRTPLHDKQGAMRGAPSKHTGKGAYLGARVPVGAAVAAEVGVRGHCADAGGRLAPLAPRSLQGAAPSLSAAPHILQVHLLPRGKLLLESSTWEAALDSALAEKGAA